MNLTLITCPAPPVTGIHSFVQGHYGTSGNLELVAPAVDGGAWVFWFNGDAAESRPLDDRVGAAARSWSGGLHFAGSDRLSAVTIGQFTAGPDFLEVVGTGDGWAHRYCWTPESGFQERPDLGVCTAASGLIEHTGLAQAALIRDGAVVLARTTLADYPDSHWEFGNSGRRGEAVSLNLVGGEATLVVISQARATVSALDGGAFEEYPGWWQQATLLEDGAVIGLDPDGQAQQAYSGSVHPLWPQLRWDAVTAARTRLDGGRYDLIGRRDTELWHAWTVGSSWTEPQLVRAAVWAQDPAAVVHRRA